MFAFPCQVQPSDHGVHVYLINTGIVLCVCSCFVIPFFFLFSFFFFPSHLLSSPLHCLSLLQPCSRNSDPGSHGRVRALHFYREKISALSSLVDSRRIVLALSLIHISEPTRPERISYAVFCLKKKIHKKLHLPTGVKK